MTLESVLLRPVTREQLFDFARRGRRDGGQPPRRPDTQTSFQSPQSPEGSKVSRRALLIGGGLTVGGGIGLAILRPWERWLSPKKDQKEPQTLEEMVAEAKRMEDGFKDKDLSDKQTREKYADILAGIFVLHYPGYISKDEIIASMIWTDSLDEFTRQKVMQDGGPALSPQEFAKEREENRFTNAITQNRLRKITINAGGELFRQENISRIAKPVLPKDWNPLKMLRLSLFHEFSHLVEENSDPLVNSILDPNNRLSDRRCEGFRFAGDEQGMFNRLFNAFHEATIEFLSKDINQKYFGFFVSAYREENGKDVSAIIGRLERILEVAGVTVEQLKYFHRNSRLKEFLFLLMDRSGAPESTPEPLKLQVGLNLVTAIENGNQRVMQNYINQTTSFLQRQAQK